MTSSYNLKVTRQKQLDDAMALWAEGVSSAEIEDITGVNRHTVRRVASERGIKHGQDMEEQRPAPVNLRPCRNMDCDIRFIPTNSNHWYHEPACAEVDSDRKRTVREVLSIEAGIEGSEMELAKAAFGQKARVTRAAHTLQGKRQYLRFELQDYLDSHPTLRLTAPLPKAFHGHKGERRIILQLSDWQVGKLENGIGVRVMEEERLPRILDAFTGIVRHFRDSGYTVNETHVVFGGDMIEGCFVYRGQNVSGLDRTDNTHRLTRQIMKTAHMQAAIVHAVAKEMERVYVHEVDGNHGRVGTRSDYADPEDNFDGMAAEWSQDLTAGIDHVTWNIADDWWNGFRVGNRYVVAFHGDQWRGPLDRIQQLLPQWCLAGVFHETPDIVLTHHRHDFAMQRVNGVTVVQNGTIDGGSNWYLKAYGKASPPEQTILVVSDEFGAEAIYPVVF